ncbi:MAG: pimeloyl-ACP methyl ester esterase BioH [Pseudomonadota bacterium]|nr:pimeloyl-ACP methyl ester esterase BioH [Pseudomonadota bacterium]
MKLTCFHNTYRSQATPENFRGDLVLLHGWGLHSIVWDSLIPELLNNYQVTVIDLPGMGQSPLPRGGYTLESLVERVLEVCPEQATFLGWSLGGIVAQRIACQAPDRVKQLVTIASTPKFCASDDWPYGIATEVIDSFLQMYEEDAEGTLIRFLALQCKDGAHYRQDVETLKRILYFCGLPAPKALREGLLILRSSDLRDEQAHIQCPTLHILGQNDNLIPVALASAWEKLAPTHRFAIMDGCSHALFLSDPEWVMQIIRQELFALDSTTKPSADTNLD